jgi:small subunit ribosomal protein S2
MKRMHDKIELYLGGIRDMDAYMVLCCRRCMGMKLLLFMKLAFAYSIIAMVDTNCDPDLVDYVIPANDECHSCHTINFRYNGKCVLEGKNIVRR